MHVLLLLQFSDILFSFDWQLSCKFFIIQILWFWHTRACWQLLYIGIDYSVNFHIIIKSLWSLFSSLKSYFTNIYLFISYTSFEYSKQSKSQLCLFFALFNVGWIIGKDFYSCFIFLIGVKVARFSGRFPQAVKSEPSNKLVSQSTPSDSDCHMHMNSTKYRTPCS